MRANLVCHGIIRQMVTATMSDYIEIVSRRTMTARVLKNMEVVEEYKLEQCDKCSQLKRLDPFGYQKGYDNLENVIWFCVDCR